MVETPTHLTFHPLCLAEQRSIGSQPPAPSPRENQSIRTSQESALAPAAVAVRVVFPKLKCEVPDSAVAPGYLGYTGRASKRSFVRDSGYNWFAPSDPWLGDSLSKLNIR